MAEVVFHFKAVGQGACTLVECPPSGATKGATILVDLGTQSGGRMDDGKDFIHGKLIPELAAKINSRGAFYLILTHRHTDHCNELEHLLTGEGRAKEPTAVYYTSVSERIWALIGDMKPNLLSGGAFSVPPSLNVGDVRTWLLAAGVARSAHVPKERAEVLVPKADDDDDAEVHEVKAATTTISDNENSAVLLFEYGGKKVILPGDAGPRTLRAVREKNPNLSCDVLKLPHHGSDAYPASRLYALGELEEFLLRTRPTRVFVSAGRSSYRHPRKATLELLLGPLPDPAPQVPPATPPPAGGHTIVFYYDVTQARLPASLTTDKPLFATRVGFSGEPSHSEQLYQDWALTIPDTGEPTVTPGPSFAVRMPGSTSP